MEASTLQFFGLCMNAGGLMTLAGILFFLHLQMLKIQEKRWIEFREELAAERKQCHDDHDAILAILQHNQETVLNLWRK